MKYVFSMQNEKTITANGRHCCKCTSQSEKVCSIGKKKKETIKT